MGDDWTEKYRPKRLSDILGNPTPVNDLRKWASSWDVGIPERRAVVIMGDPGIGKTSAAEALANEMGWELVEMNASDERTGDAISDVALRGSLYNTFSDDGTYLDSKANGRKLIVLDEADNFFGNADRGAMPIVNNLINNTLQPVILIVNDFYELSRKSQTVKNNTLQLTFRRPQNGTVASILKKISSNEGIEADQEVLLKIAENANGDIRGAIRDLESISQGKAELVKGSTDVLSGRTERKDIYHSMGLIFRKGDAMEARRSLNQLDLEPRDTLLWIDENLPYEYTDKGDLVRGFEMLSRADVFLGRVHRRQYYGFWSYASDMMSAGVSVAKMSKTPPSGRFRFPEYLSKMSRSKSIRVQKRSICEKVAIHLHTSTKRVSLDVLEPMRQLAMNDFGIRRMLVTDAGLTAEELGFLIGKKVDSPMVKAVMSDINAKVTDSSKEGDERPAPKKERTNKPMGEAPKVEPKPAEDGAHRQQSLFDF